MWFRSHIHAGCTVTLDRSAEAWRSCTSCPRNYYRGHIITDYFFQKSYCMHMYFFRVFRLVWFTLFSLGFPSDMFLGVCSKHILPAILCTFHQRNWKALSSLIAQMAKNPRAVQETQVWSLSWEDPLEKGMATQSRILAWRIPWTEEPGGLQCTGSHRAGHDWSDLAGRQF